MANTIVTISDVARAAGVTNGTVDRVLHERGEVSPKTREKVLRVIGELGYQPNVYASMLARNRSHSIALILPKFKAGEFWELTHNGVEAARDYAGRFSVNIVEKLYDQYDVDSFLASCREAISEGCSGAIIAPMFLDETRRVAGEMDEAGVPLVVLNTSVSDTNTYLAYFGQPIYESGLFAADTLMGGAVRKDKVYLVRIERDTRGLSDPSSGRRRGFLDYFSRHYPGTVVENVVINPNDPAEATKVMDSAFGNIREGANIITLNSRIFLVADYLKKRGLKGLNVVGYDVLGRNLEALREGYVRYLIGQHPDRDAQNAVSALTDFLVLGKKPAKRDNFSSLDLLSKYNCRFY